MVQLLYIVGFSHILQVNDVCVCFFVSVTKVVIKSGTHLCSMQPTTYYHSFLYLILQCMESMHHCYALYLYADVCVVRHGGCEWCTFI